MAQDDDSTGGGTPTENGDNPFMVRDEATQELLKRIAVSSVDIDFSEIEEGEPEGLDRETVETLLDEGHLVPALFVAAAKLEREMGFVARREMDLSEHAFMTDWTETGLPKFVQLNNHLEWIEDAEPVESLSGFKTDIMHNWGEMYQVMAHPEMRAIIEEVVRDVIELTEQLEAERLAGE